MCRKGNNIFKRKDGRFEARYIKAYLDSGKAVYGYVYGKSYEEARRKRNKVLIEYKEIKKPKVDRTRKAITLSIMLDTWLEFKKDKIKESTYGTYYQLIETYIKPFIGNIKKAKITEDKINHFLKDKFTIFKLSNNTVYNIALILKETFSFYKLNLKLMTVNKEYKNAKTFYEKEKELLKSNICKISKQEQVGIYLSLYLGLRKGEVCAITWGDIDLTNKILHIRNTVSRVPSFDTKKKTKLIITPPKTKNSIRDLPIPDNICKMLENIKKEDKIYLLTETTEFIDPRTYYNHFKRFLKSIGLENHTYHQLRHTFATDCIEHEIDAKTLMELLGHANINTTLSIYVHPSMKKKRKLVNQL